MSRRRRIPRKAGLKLGLRRDLDHVLRHSPGTVGKRTKAEFGAVIRKIRRAGR